MKNRELREKRIDETLELPDNADWSMHLGRKGFRLLTEAEWEYASRCGKSTAYGFGNDPTWLDFYGWYQAISRKDLIMPVNFARMHLEYLTCTETFWNGVMIGMVTTTPK